MKQFLALAALAGAFALAAPAQADARAMHQTRNCPSPESINRQARAGANMIPGYGQYLESCIVHRRMRKLFKECMIAAGVGAGVVGIVGLISQAAAAVIAKDMLAAAAGNCITHLALK